jgi:ribosome-binding factor A
MGQSHRTLKVADRIKVVVANLLETKIKDPRLGFVTVTDARVTGDLQQASIFYTVLGDLDERAATAAALESAKGAIRSALGRELGLRITPSIEFFEDDCQRVPKPWIHCLKKYMSKMLKLPHFARMRSMQGEKILTKLHVLLKINCDPNSLRARVFGCR